MVKLILIRHGETRYNSEQRYCGFSDPPLNKKGIKEAKELSIKLTGIEIDAVYSSDLERAYRTAKIVFGDSPIKRLEDFREMNFGIFEGLKYEEIVKRYHRLYRDWIHNPMKVVIPCGETLKDLVKRVRRAVSFIAFHHEEETIAIVSHSGPIRIILCEVLKKSLRSFWHIEPGTGTLEIIDYHNEPSYFIRYTK